MARRYMHGKRRRKSPLLDNPTNVVSAKLKKDNKEKSNIFKGSYAKGHASEKGYNIEGGGELGIKTKYGDISGTVHARTEKSKYYTGGGITPGVKITTTFGKLKKLFKR